MFISALELFKIGIGPSSSHTIGPMIAARQFMQTVATYLQPQTAADWQVHCILKGSLAYTGKGHATDRAVMLGLHGYEAENLHGLNVSDLVETLATRQQLDCADHRIAFKMPDNIAFDFGEPLPEHPNGMILRLLDESGQTALEETYFSIGGGFIATKAQLQKQAETAFVEPALASPYPFDTAKSMLAMAKQNSLSIAEMKLANELTRYNLTELHTRLDAIWHAMRDCVEAGLKAEGTLPGGLNVKRRAKALLAQIENDPETTVNDWLCAYAMAVNEENAAGHRVVTAPTNGAAGVIPAVLYYYVTHHRTPIETIREFLLTASAIGGLIKHMSSISGAEVGCQGEVGSASAMAAAGLCAIRGGTPEQIENAAEIALEHHLGMTCDPVMGLVQIPCIERNGFGAIKAYAAASLALRGNGEHFMPLDSCIKAMKETGLEMSHKYKETSLGGLAVHIIEC
ncbi:L-serine ammonia-lyase [Thiomicrorhabdus cannonii]|uniref:L-serine ammonia-lyase n=1 Tax=Thiomicrorhabdus cannonii TaxID=2748011 RepID=UPI0015C1802B|nr:L-serine ammonia-lyase [Thiomicrorhabdus cannonii]